MKRLEQQDHKEWIEQIMDYKEKYPMTYHPDVLSGPFVVEEIYRQTNGDAIIVTEVGQHQMWAAQYYKYTEPRTLLDLRRTWNHGIWSWCCTWSTRSEDPDKDGRQYCRRRMFPYEYE